MVWRRAVWAAALSGLVLVAPGCGEDEPAPATPPAAPPSAGGATRLIVEVRPRGPKGPERRRTVDCSNGTADPIVCRRLQALPFDAFEPLAPDTVCTQIYGGPATAVVRGRLRGRRVTGRFSRRNGCHIARWDRLSWLLGDPPGAAPGRPNPR